ncbi:hypothetical protein [Agromyces sp. SYSU T00266]|uniref:hypothetical protein n=1 Tax=Agromyces zhanjiangensis TaxID=3158562 RepID=UPI003394071F
MIDTTAPGRPTSPADPRRGFVSSGTPSVGTGTTAPRAAASVAPTGRAVAA